MAKYNALEAHFKDLRQRAVLKDKASSARMSCLWWHYGMAKHLITNTIKYDLFTFRESLQYYKIHMEIVNTVHKSNKNFS
jgi:hypothetical protein